MLFLNREDHECDTRGRDACPLPFNVDQEVSIAPRVKGLSIYWTMFQFLGYVSEIPTPAVRVEAKDEECAGASLGVPNTHQYTINSALSSSTSKASHSSNLDRLIH